ncbi:MAG: HU family DNA-binding protein [Planctomycetota bacterium]
MNKAELITTVAKNTKTSKAAAERATNLVLESIKRGVKRDGNVTLIGFGTFTVKSRKARMGRNPQTGEPIKIKASRTVGFKPGQAFKKMV